MLNENVILLIFSGGNKLHSKLDWLPLPETEIYDRALRIDKCVHEFNEKKANGLNACDMWLTLRECHHTQPHNDCGYLIFESRTNRLNSPVEIFQFRFNSISTMHGLVIPWLVALHVVIRSLMKFCTCFVWMLNAIDSNCYQLVIARNCTIE